MPSLTWLKGFSLNSRSNKFGFQSPVAGLRLRSTAICRFDPARAGSRAGDFCRIPSENRKCAGVPAFSGVVLSYTEFTERRTHGGRGGAIEHRTSNSWRDRLLRGARRLDQPAAVNHAGQRAAEQRADPVNPLVGPMSAGQRRSKCAGRVHGGAGKWAAEQDVQGHGEADGQAADFRRAGVHGGAVNDEHEEKSEDRFDEDAIKSRDAFGSQIGCAGGDNGLGQGTTFLGIDLIGENKEQYESGNRSARELGYPISDGGAEIHFAPDEQAERNGWIEMAAGNSAGGGSHDRNGEPVRQRDSEQARVVIDRADADEDQRKGSDEFRGTLFGQGRVHNR
jgi:hypothetical protein